MGDGLGRVALFCAGYAVAAAALGLGGEAVGRRVVWGVVLGAAGVLLLVPVVLVVLLSGGLPRLGSISWSVWAFVLGVVAAGGAWVCKALGVGWAGARVEVTGSAVVAVVLLSVAVVAVGWGVSSGRGVVAGGLHGGGAGEDVSGVARGGDDGRAGVVGADGTGGGVIAGVESLGVANGENRTLPAAVGCDCADRSVCEGPRGGRYCLRPDGSKKYKP